jgi:predicted amidohydrolase YtcJ
VVDAREALTVEQAVAAYTTGGFRAIHGVPGRGLAVGAPADFVVLDGHPMRAASRVVETWIDGQLAWST